MLIRSLTPECVPQHVNVRPAKPPAPRPHDPTSYTNTCKRKLYTANTFAEVDYRDLPLEGSSQAPALDWRSCAYGGSYVRRM
eukprot:1393162-Amorphochlora_amoeboformis.AAC.2